MPTYLVSFGINHLSCFQDSEPVDILHPARSLPVKWLQHVATCRRYTHKYGSENVQNFFLCERNFLSSVSRRCQEEFIHLRKQMDMLQCINVHSNTQCLDTCTAVELSCSFGNMESMKTCLFLLVGFSAVNLPHPYTMVWTATTSVSTRTTESIHFVNCIQLPPQDTGPWIW